MKKRDIFNDRAHSHVPINFTPHPIRTRVYWKQGLKGIIYTTDKDEIEFYSGVGHRKKEKAFSRFSRQDRIRNLLERQKFLLDDMDAVFSVPTNAKFYERLGLYVFKGEVNYYNGKWKPQPAAYWYYMCLSGLFLIRNFGGYFDYSKSRNVFVKLERVKVIYYIENAIKANDSYHAWFLELCSLLWNQVNRGHLQDFAPFRHVEKWE